MPQPEEAIPLCLLQAFGSWKKETDGVPLKLLCFKNLWKIFSDEKVQQMMIQIKFSVSR